MFQEFNDAAVLFLDEALCEPFVKSYLGTPDAAFQELHLPVACHQAMGPFGISAETQAELAKRSHVVFIVHGNPDSAQLVAQYLLEIKGCGAARRAAVADSCTTARTLGETQTYESGS